MSAFMILTVALFFGVHGNEDLSNDWSSLLQASVHEKANVAEDHATVETSSVACESFKQGGTSGNRLTSVDDDEVSTCATPVANIVVTKAAPALEGTVAVPPSSPVQDDPPGAATFKAVLELMIVVLFVDGLRRWRNLQHEAARQPKVIESSVDRAWEELLKAASVGDEPSFKKIDLNKSFGQREDIWGCTALHFAATGGSIEIATDLLQLGAEVDAKDGCDETALHFAARAGHVSMCDLLLNNGASANLLNEQDMTPLVVAGHATQEAACRFLFDHGANAGGMLDEDLPLLVVSQVLRKVLEGT